MRGQVWIRGSGCTVRRITPADAGTSWQVLRLQPLPPDHPRGCGDKCDWMAFFISSCGSPPRMRGQDTWVSMDCHTPRITPADAGTRALMREGLNEMKDHPRGCGDKNYFSINFYWFIGSPPRMRGQVIPPGLSLSRCWITPADAGTSCHNQATVTFLGDHPRGCGDKKKKDWFVPVFLGSPPRMRGQVHGFCPRLQVTRITPADAGTSITAPIKDAGVQDHPRGCGDKFQALVHPSTMPGSPPRMRGQGVCPLAPSLPFRITPADAGTREAPSNAVSSFADHPRGCGDKAGLLTSRARAIGSPPRMRGQVSAVSMSQPDIGITPADAGTSQLCGHTGAPTRDHPRGCGDKTRSG